MLRGCTYAYSCRLATLLPARLAKLLVHRRAHGVAAFICTPTHHDRSSRSLCFISATAQDQAAMSAIPSESWASVETELQVLEQRREQVSQYARATTTAEQCLVRIAEVKRLARQAVFALHKGDMATSEQLLQRLEAHVQGKLLPLAQEQPTLRHQVFGGCMEEATCALVLKTFLQRQCLASPSELPYVEPEEYLGGVLDFTQELNRHAIQQATRRNVQAVEACRHLVDVLMGHYLQFDFRNSPLRRKFDGLKYTLKKLENTLYELSLVEPSSSRPGQAVQG